jgi:hypothetical protein
LYSRSSSRATARVRARTGDPDPVRLAAGRGPDAELLVDLAFFDERRGRDIRQRRVRAAAIDAGFRDDVPGLAGGVIRPHQAQGRLVAVGREHVRQPQVGEVARYVFQVPGGYLERGHLAGDGPRLVRDCWLGHQA